MDLLVSESELKVYPSPYARDIKVFSEIIERDNTESKEVARKELAYVYHMSSTDSVYFNYSEEDRKQEVINDYFDSDWEPDELVDAAIARYKELTTTKEERLLESAGNAIDKLSAYLDDIDLTAVDDRGKPKHSAKDLVQNLKRIPDVVDSLRDLRKQVEKGRVDEGQVRAGAELTEFNR